MYRVINYISNRQWLITIVVLLMTIWTVVNVAFDLAEPYDCSFYPQCNSHSVYSVGVYCFDRPHTFKYMATCPTHNNNCSVRSFYDNHFNQVLVNDDLECQLDRRIKWRK